MNDTTKSTPSVANPLTAGKHDHTILLLQGGGALGAYQAGAFEGLAEAGVQPDWSGLSVSRSEQSTRR